MACFVLVPLFLLKKYYDKEVPGLYGLSRSKSLIRGYLTLFFIMLPFLIAASFTSDFQYSYPQFPPQSYSGVFGMPAWLYTFLFEACYAVDFVLVELIFRGVLVVGMIRLLGTKAVLPMVAFYVSIHFGKPLMETCSSMFGGFILGALAYQTKHIWGGVIVHIGIALVMEIMGFVQYYLLK
jgi:membrane protease YdiL (CAAX protease family)